MIYDPVHASAGRASSGRKTALHGERGSTIVLVSLAIAGLLGIVALAVDIGMLFTARGEAQRAADAAALAGAGSLIVEPGNEDRARTVAIRYGNLNTVRDETAGVQPEDVVVDLDADQVTVTVYRTEERGSAVATWFANVFGVAAVDVAARATAEAAPTGAAACVSPFSVADGFLDQDGDGIFDEGEDEYDPEVHGYGTSWRNTGSPGDDGLGYENDRGREVVIKGGGPGQAGGNPGNQGGSEPGTGPGWYLPWDHPQVEENVCPGGPGGQGASCYQWAIENCHPAVISIGQQYWTANGAMDEPTFEGVQTLIDADPDAYWDTGTNTVAGSIHGEDWEASSRIVIVPTFDPSREFESGKQPIEFTNFIAVYIEAVEGEGTFQKVRGRILGATGVSGGDPDAMASAAKSVRLVE
ncbi:MAG TPA: pilus assembly protein TadG-related protein [Gemmatimonadota bacterium]|nr:pilus assembly protein TadG-related protein [Gemmatimonadota bacterium]